MFTGLLLVAGRIEVLVEPARMRAIDVNQSAAMSLRNAELTHGITLFAELSGAIFVIAMLGCFVWMVLRR
jgi:hypothetical protein